MSATTGERRGQGLMGRFMGRFMGRLVEPLLDALSDPSRRERTVVAVLMAYVGLWTLYGTLAKGSQDIHSDMSEQFALSRELAWGYPKHPPSAWRSCVSGLPSFPPSTGPTICWR
jgi:hypothetical protein